MHYETGDHHGIKYRVIREAPRDYQLSIWCDCVYGLHWHEIGHFDSKVDAYAALNRPITKGI